MKKFDYPVYALYKNKVVSIDDVDKGQVCVCPQCSSELVLKKGNVRRHHFAHKPGAVCNYCYQSSLHLLAKDILQEAREIYLPPIYANFHEHSILFPINEAQTLSIKDPINDIKLEQNFGSIIPDIVISFNTHQLFVEIYVTHKIDNEKLKKIIEKDISTIEIDLSDVDRLITRDDLKTILLGESNNKYWVYSKLANQWRNLIINNSVKKEIHKAHQFPKLNIAGDIFYFVNHCPIADIRGKARKHWYQYGDIRHDCSWCSFCAGIFRNKDTETTNSLGTILCFGNFAPDNYFSALPTVSQKYKAIRDNIIKKVKSR